MNKGALYGIRIVDLTQFQSGTVCTMTLAWLGAEVIKVERPKVGELNRYSVVEPGIDSFSFITCNANKKSITLDAKSPEGKQILWKLIEKSDVFIENMSPASLNVWDSATMLYISAAQIVYAQIKGFELTALG
jgi:formyl-CoA transferase